MKRFLKITIVTFLSLTTVFFATIAIIFIVPTKMRLNEKSLINSSDFASFYDAHNLLLSSDRQSVDINEDIPTALKNAVVSAEDKNFYSHKGVDILRMIKAGFVDLKNGDFSQGASTISQQLIKNTHLSQEKTISRKVTEIKLAKELEKNYTKDQILNMYLNTVYFGQNRYGIKDAAKYYFSKELNELDLNECATLIGIIPSPSKYNPIDNITLTIKKRNVVLDRMLKNGYIDEETANNVKKSEIKLNITEINENNAQYIAAATEEIFEKTSLSPYDIVQAKIYTYLDQNVQALCIDAKTENDLDYQAIVVDNETMGITAYYSTCGQIKRSPASTIKPLLVYAPALEEGVINEMTKLSDEPVTLSGYSPQNYKGKYYGEVTAKFALSNSLNVPTVKLYNSLGAENCKKYLEKMQIYDKNSALNAALGQFDEGITVKELAQAYAVFPNYGVFKQASFIRKIVDKFGKTIYEADHEERKVFHEGTATIINDILKDCVIEGTAKKLYGKNYELCAKTGTSGNENGNTDAYVCAYTTENTVLCWSGYSDSGYMDNSVTGGSTPCVSANHILNGLYSEHTPKNFEQKGVRNAKIDRILYDEKGEFLLAEDDATPREYYEFLFDERYVPTQKIIIEAPDISDIKIKISEQNITFALDGNSDINIIVQRKNPFGITSIFEGNISDFKDYYENETEYIITPFRLRNNKKIYGTAVEKKVDAPTKKSGIIPDEWWIDD